MEQLKSNWHRVSVVSNLQESTPYTCPMENTEPYLLNAVWALLDTQMDIPEEEFGRLVLNQDGMAEWQQLTTECHGSLPEYLVQHPECLGNQKLQEILEKAVVKAAAAVKHQAVCIQFWMLQDSEPFLTPGNVVASEDAMEEGFSLAILRWYPYGSAVRYDALIPKQGKEVLEIINSMT